MSRDLSRTSRPLDRVLAVAVAETMQALSTPSRLPVLDHLRSPARPVNEIAKAVGMKQPAVTHKLRILRHLEEAS